MTERRWQHLGRGGCVLALVGDWPATVQPTSGWRETTAPSTDDDLTSPTLVAVLRGRCAGADLGAVARADVVLAASDLEWTAPAVGRGGVTERDFARWAVKLSFGALASLALCGEGFSYTAADAVRVGLVTRVHAADELLDAAVGVARRIGAASPTAVARTRELLRATVEHRVGLEFDEPPLVPPALTPMTASTGPFDTVLADFHDGVLTVQLDRPDRLNAIDARMRADLAALWAEWARDPRLRVVVVTGAGRAFSSGADVGGLVKAVRPSADLDDALGFLPGRTLSVPVVLALNGLCVGGALQFVADADVVVASSEAWLCSTHTTMGQVAGLELVRLAARTSSRTTDLLALCGMSNRTSAAVAYSAGLVDEVVAPAALAARALQLAHLVARQHPEDIRPALGILRRTGNRTLRDRLTRTWSDVVGQWAHPDAMEGPRAHAERRAPVFEEVAVP